MSIGKREGQLAEPNSVFHRFSVICSTNSVELDATVLSNIAVRRSASVPSLAPYVRNEPALKPNLPRAAASPARFCCSASYPRSCPCGQPEKGTPTSRLARHRRTREGREGSLSGAS